MSLLITKMQTTLELPNKIKWDKRENKNKYKIYYYDRRNKKNIEVRFKDIKILLNYL